MLTLEEQNKLVETHIPLAKNLAYRKAKSTRMADYDELLSAAYFGLVDASRKFDSERSVSFGSYAKWRISGAILDSIRSNMRNVKTCDNLETIQAKEESVDNSFEFFEKVSGVFDDGVAKNVVLMYYKQGETLRSIATKFGVTVGRISQILKESREIMRISLDESQMRDLAA